MNILFTIAGREGSKGVKNKNIRDFLGFPLVYYPLSAIQMYKEKHRENNCYVCLSTDSNRLTDIVKNQHFINDCYFISRTSELSDGITPKIAVISDCYLRSTSVINSIIDVVIDLDITSPMRKVSDIEKIIEEQQRTNSDVVFSVTDSRRNPYFNMIKKEDGKYSKVIDSNYTARQQAPEVYDINGSIYAYAPSFLRQKKQDIFSGKCGIIKMRDTAILDIDSEEDFELLEIVAKYLFSIDSEYKAVQQNIEAHQ